jgi:cell wall hydrolase
MSSISLTDNNEPFHSIKTLMRRPFPLFHFSKVIALGAFSFCLLFPLSPTPANSNDMALALSSHSQSSQSLSDKPYIPVTPHSDDTLAALTIYLEARGESFAGKMAVAAVIRNRINHKYHSDGTIRGTVLRAKQFEPWIGRSPKEVRFNPNNRKMQESLLAWKLVQDGRNVVNGAVLFYNPTLVIAPRWAKVYQKVAKIGGHEFFNKHHI